MSDNGLPPSPRFRRPFTMDTPEEPESPLPHTTGTAYPAGNDDFRAARDCCSQACRRFNETPEDASPELRSSRFLEYVRHAMVSVRASRLTIRSIIRPARDRSDDSSAAITHDMTFRSPGLKARTPFVKPPFYVDYGLRVRIGGSTFINRNCMIMDTPTSDVIIGERCNIGPNCIIISVDHASRAKDRAANPISIGKPVIIEDDVFMGANVQVL